jgi:transposase
MTNEMSSGFWMVRVRELEKDLNLALKRIGELEKSNVKKDTVILQRAERIEELEEEIRKLKGQGKNMKRMIFKAKTKKKGKNKQGTKKGHKVSFRRKPAQEEITDEKEVFLSQCPKCDHDLHERDRTGHTDRYGIDIPFTVQPIVTHYDITRYQCPGCHSGVQGTPRDLFGKSPFGINIMMTVLHMKYRGKATDDHIQETFSIIHGVDLSDGVIHKILDRTALLFGSSYESIKQSICEGKVVHADETGWRVDGENWYAWAFTNDRAVLYSIENTRGGGIPKDILEDFYGVLVTDGYQGYNSVEGVERALCGVHFLRPIKHLSEMEEASDEAKWFFENMKWFYRIARKRHKRGKTDDERLDNYQLMKKVLERYWKNKTYEDKEVEKIRKWWLEARHEQLLTFLRHEDVPWENNAAERAVRPIVRRRKMNGGSRSERGAEREAINMSVFATLVKQKKSLFEEIPGIFRTAFREQQKQKAASG